MRTASRDNLVWRGGWDNSLILVVAVLAVLAMAHPASAQSCAGKCGGKSGSCWCDDACTGYGDCCSDYSSECQTQGQGDCHSGSLGSSKYCSSSCPCGEGEGDCDNDGQCDPGLVCVKNVGASYGYSSGTDVCEAPGTGDCHSGALGSWKYCSAACPCEAGEGDCDDDNECAQGLICVFNVGGNYGFSSGTDVCDAPDGGGDPFAYFTIETAHFAGNSKNSYFFLRVRPELTLAYLKITFTFSGQKLRNVLPAEQIIPSSTAGAWGDLLSGGTVAVVIEGVSEEIPGVGFATSILSVVAEFFDNLGEASQIGATELVFDGVQAVAPGDSIDSYIWTKGSSSLSVFWTVEYAHSPSETISTQNGMLTLRTGAFTN